MKVLFICNFGRNRSRTAAEIFADKFQTDYAGVFNNIVTKEQIRWADLIVCMEEEQKLELQKMMPKETRSKSINVLNIEDVYRYRDEDLIEKLKSKSEEIKA